MRAELDLVRQGTVSAEDLVTAIERQHEARPQLGQIAIEERLLTPRQVREVLYRQCETPHLRFGEVAIELGLMTDRELGYLLLKQQIAQGPLMNHLIALGSIDEQAAEAACSNRCWCGDNQLLSV